MKILLAEDDPYKCESVRALLGSVFPEASLLVMGSVTSASSALQTTAIDIAVLDMSLPTYEPSETEGGGKPRGFGGVDLMRVIDALSPGTRAIVVTQFERFETNGRYVDLAALEADLRAEFPEAFVGLVFYQHSREEWKPLLRDLLQAAEAGGAR